jgi:hypothetical protein
MRRIKIVEHDYNLKDLLNWAFFIALFWGADRIPHTWAFRLAAAVVFCILNYRVVVGSVEAARTPIERSPKRIYHSPSFWWLGALSAYFVYALVNTGWIFWFLLFAGMLGAGVATVLRYQQPEA